MLFKASRTAPVPTTVKAVFFEFVVDPVANRCQSASEVERRLVLLTSQDSHGRHVDTIQDDA